MTKVRRALGVVAVAGVTALVLTSCTSEPDASSTSSSASAVATSEAASEAASPEASAATDTAAAQACAAYFELDLLNSSYAGGAVADGDMTEAQVKADFKRLLKTMKAQATIAVAEGSADPKLEANSARMKKIVKNLAKDEALNDLSKAKQNTFAKSSLRVQRACERAGFALPADNVTARTAAGL